MKKVLIEKASDYNFRLVKEVEENDFFDFITDLIKEEGAIIVDESLHEEYDFSIVIYDDYIE